MRADPRWIDRVVESLTDTVYITIDVDGLDPAIMPATGTPEPGGLSWYETLALLRAVIERRTVVGCDIVELSPMAGNVAPNFLCAKLIYKILSYRFGREVTAETAEKYCFCELRALCGLGFLQCLELPARVAGKW
jgi:agmatinase